MQDFPRARHLAARIVHYRPHLTVFMVPLLTAVALREGLALSMVFSVLALQMMLLFWVVYPNTPPMWESAGGRHPAPQDRTRLEAGFSATPMGMQSAALAVRLDDADRHKRQHGERFLRTLTQELGNRLAQSLREQDGYCLLEPASFGVALFPQRGLDLGSVLSVSQRIQTQLAQPFRFEGVTIWPSVSIGFCQSQRAAALNGLNMLQAAEQAALRAQASGPSGLRSYSVVDFPAAMATEHLDDLRNALETGEIRAYFQPQVRTTSGEVSGFEALARWVHPQRGLISPADFLPQLEAAGLSPKLAECMLKDALKMLAHLEAQGHHVPTVSVNLSTEELRNPRLADEISWELDRYNLSPDRLTLEILETVVADGDEDVAVRTIARLASMGCGIDLDDFGTGHASIANIRRFAVGRIKIDRSFVTRMHDDRDQQRMVAAILSMAEQLELQTIAEGVECAEEQVMLAQMGCHHLQGFAIARPMPAEDLLQWLSAHETALSQGEPWCEDATQARAVSGT